MGYRYRINLKDLPGKPDIVFLSKKRAIFVHGCFWHQHTDPKCQYTHSPQSRRAYWIPKLDNNVKRDEENLLKLKRLGWDTLVIWECALERPSNVTHMLIEFLGAPKIALGQERQGKT